MKLLLSLLIIVTALQLPAQSITVSGKILNGNREPVRVYFNNTRFDYKDFAVDEANQFLFSFTPKNLYNFIRIEGSEIVLQSGDSVFVSLQGDSIVDNSGGNAALNKSLLELQQWQSGLWKSSREDTLTEFLNKMKQWYSTHLQQIDACKFVNGNADRDLALSYLNIKRAAISYAYLTDITMNMDTLRYAEAMNSQEMKWLIDLKDYNDTIVGQSLPYYMALQFYLYFKMKIDYDESKSYVQNLWDHIKALNLPKPNNDVAYCLIYPNFFNIGYTYYDNFFQDADSLLQYFEVNADEKENAEYLRNEFERQYEYLRPGHQIKDVELTDTLGNKYLLSDFKDKIIYVKMWSLSCKGCIQSIPEYNELLADFADTNVIFISIAMDRPKYVEQWKSTIRAHDLQGLNFISEKGLYLGNYGLPKYYIIGKGNTIVNLNAPGPRSSELKAMLEELVRVEGK